MAAELLSTEQIFTETDRLVPLIPFLGNFLSEVTQTRCHISSYFLQRKFPVLFCESFDRQRDF